MIGVFDSGEGGMNAARYLERIVEEDIIFFPDRKHAPYGTKDPDTLTRLLSEGIDLLLSFGADRILIACCTAGTVYHRLPPEKRRVSMPIIYPTARQAVRLTQSGRVALIATDATVRSGAFNQAFDSIHKSGETGKTCSLISVAAQPLVSMVERGAVGEKMTPSDKEELYELLLPLKDRGADTLILGCTHFPSLEADIRGICEGFGIKFFVSSVKEGADAFLKATKKITTDRAKRRIFLALGGNINRN